MQEKIMMSQNFRVFPFKSLEKFDIMGKKMFTECDGLGT